MEALRREGEASLIWTDSGTRISVFIAGLDDTGASKVSRGDSGASSSETCANVLAFVERIGS